jgi:NAD(P)-dependent dehydrogenase (short-subunit alcohol dehydrogenase family)
MASDANATRRILVTGANKGIGLAIVEAALQYAEDTFVLLGSRDFGRGQRARELLLGAHSTWTDRIEVLELDVSSDDSVIAAAAHVRSRFSNESHPLYGIVNNAGIGSQGLAEVLDINAVGTHRVCSAFLPLLRPAGGRVVNVTSAAGPNFVSACAPERQRFLTNPEVTWTDLEVFLEECRALDGPEAFAAAGLGDGNPYGLSKAVANAYTLCLAREYPKLVVNACTPGFIETDLTRGFLAARGKSAADAGMKTPAEGARAPTHLLFAPLEGTGRYYGSDAQRSPLDRYRSPGDPPYTGE